MINNISDRQTITSFRGHYLLKMAVFFMLVQSFVISTIVKGLILSYVFILLLFFKDLILNTTKETTLHILFGLLKFIAIFGAIQIIIQFLNVVTNPYFGGLNTLSLEPSNVIIFRKSLFTQSSYLITSIILFLYFLSYLKKDGKDRILKIARTGVILFVLYGFFEFFGFLITGENVDIISNRIAGVNDRVIGFFQVVKLGGIEIQRMKSLAGEPSMFAFSILPFMILFYYLKDKIYILLLIALILSTATTGVIGILFFILIEILFFKEFIKLIFKLTGVFAVLLFLFYDVVFGFFNFTYDKFSMLNVSSIARLNHLYTHFSFFLESDIFHMLFGYGFGYFRSTDGLSTLLVNTGLLGLCSLIFFVVYPLIKIRLNSNYKIGVAVASIVQLLVMMISVAEFYYIQIWFFAALAWFEYYKENRGK